MTAVVRLRRAETADVRRLWIWRNDPETRLASLDGEEIPYDDHIQWFEGQLRSADAALFIIEGGPEPIPCGQIRLSRLACCGAVISIGLARESRGRGLGVAALKEIQRWPERPPWANPIYAVIRLENDRSRRVFEAVGFVGPSEEGATLVGGVGKGVGVWVLRLQGSEPEDDTILR